MLKISTGEIMADKYAITCARLTSRDAVRDISDAQDMGNILEHQVNDLAEQGYAPVDITSGRDIACVLMRK